jgi:predicted oxidoreductase
VVNWPERGLFHPGNSVPRWHIAWGTGYGIIETLLSHLETHPRRNNLRVFFNHQVNQLITTNNKITGCAGILEGTNEEFSAEADAVVAASGGIHGSGSLEGTFLGGCILTGRIAGKSIPGVKK